MKGFMYMLSEAQFHGARRLIESKYRCWWAVSLAIYFWAACSIIVATTSRYMEHPAFLLVSESMNRTLVFPSVAVCPEVEYPDYKIEELLLNLTYPSGMNKSGIKVIIQQLAAFYSPDVTYSTADLKKIELFLAHNKISVEHATTRLSVTCEEAVLKCRLFNVLVNCSSIFIIELTTFGYCCIFNGRSLRKEIEYRGDNKPPQPPVVLTEEDGFSSGLMIAVNSSQRLTDIDLTYKWLYLESGLHYAEAAGNGTPLSPNKEVWFAFNSDRFIINEDAASLTPELRKCYMTLKLKYFPYYTMTHCLIECEMRRIRKRCGCVRFTLPRPRHGHWPRCDAQKLLCVKNNAVPYSTSMNECKCFPRCQRNIEVITTQSFLTTPGTYFIDPFYNDLDFSKVTILRVYLAGHNSKTYIRSSYFSPMKLFSQIGGTMSVFFGCSILTVVELVQLIWFGYCHYRTGKLNRNLKAKIPAQTVNKKIKKIKIKSKNEIKKTVRFQRITK